MNLATTAPRYDGEAVERIRALITSGVRGRTPAQVGLLAFMTALFPGHIYGVWESGDVDTLAAVTVADLQSYRTKALALDNLKVVAVGNIDKDALSAWLAEAFAGLPAHALLTPIPEAVAAAARRVDTSAAVTATTVRFGGPGMKRTDPDFVAASAAAFILGGRDPSSRLSKALVVDRALTSAVSLTLNATERGGWFAGNSSVRPADADAAIAILDQEARRLANEGPTADEVARAQGYLVNTLLAHFDSDAGAATELVSAFAAGLGADYADHYVDAVVAMTPDDVKRAAQRMFAGGMVMFTTAPATTP
jgi:zinc protease